MKGRDNPRNPGDDGVVLLLAPIPPPLPPPPPPPPGLPPTPPPSPPLNPRDRRDYPRRNQSDDIYRIHCSCKSCGAGIRVTVSATSTGINSLQQQFMDGSLAFVCPACSDRLG